MNNTTYRQLIEIFIYLAINNLELSYTISILLFFMHEPREIHWNAITRVLRYIQGTKYFGLIYKNTNKFVLCGCSNPNFLEVFMIDHQHELI